MAPFLTQAKDAPVVMGDSIPRMNGHWGEGELGKSERATVLHGIHFISPSVGGPLFNTVWLPTLADLRVLLADADLCKAAETEVSAFIDTRVDPLPPEIDEVIYQPSIRQISSLPDNYGIGVGVFVTDAFAFVLQRMIQEAMAQHRARELDRVWEQSAIGGKRPRL